MSEVELTEEEAIARAESIEYLKSVLREKIITVVFRKKDGTERNMLCTLRPDVLPPMPEKDETAEPKKERKVNPDVIAVYDIEANGWRSFQFDSLIKIVESGEIK